MTEKPKYTYEPLTEMPKVGDKVYMYHFATDKYVPVTVVLVDRVKGGIYTENKNRVSSVSHYTDFFKRRLSVTQDKKHFDDEMDAISYAIATIPVPDNVNSPAHYTQGKIETIDIIEQTVSNLPPKRAYALGNVIKYVSRHQYKNGLEDLEKAAWYLNRAIEQYEDNE